MKNKNQLSQTSKTLLTSIVAASLVLSGLAVSSAQVVNFDAPGGLGSVNYSGLGAYTDLTTNGAIITTNSYWNPIAKGGTTPTATGSDGVTANPITLTDTSPSSYGTQGANGTPEGLQAPFLLENNGTPVVETLNNVPAGTYELYLYGLNGGGNADRGATFTVSNASVVYGAQSCVGQNAFINNNTIPNTNFVQGVNYVKYKVVMEAAGALTFTYAANTNINRPGGLSNQDYAGHNGEGDFNGLQLVFVSSSTVLPANTLALKDVSPDGASLFSPSSTLSFMASSLDGVDPSGVTVTLTGTNMNGTTGYTMLLTSGNGLTTTTDLTGTNLTVSAPLTNNFFYTASISVVDLDGYVTNYTYVFDTISSSSVYTFEAEDFNYNSGMFIDDPAPDAYAGLNAVQGTDVNDPNNASEMQAYGRSGLETQVTGDKSRAVFSGHTDYDVGDNNSGNWANYTRTFPKGPYIVYLRASSPTNSSDSATLSESDGGTLTPLGTFSVPATNNLQTYAWVPLLDSNGSPAVFASDGVTPATLQIGVDGGGYNANFYMLVSVNTNTVAITNIYPNGTNQFQTADAFSFTINSSDAVDATNISVSVAGTNLLGLVSVTNLTGATLPITGPVGSQTISIPLESNTVYGVSIQVTDESGIMASTNLSFDTVTPAYIFEVEDFNYTLDGTTGGEWADPFIDGLYGEFQGLAGVLGVDYYSQLNASGTNEQSSIYRGVGGTSGQPLTPGNEALDTENSGDPSHLAVYAAPSLTQDYDSGNATAGNWGNYTRVYPAGTYNVYMRVASPNAPIADAMSLSLVTGDTTTSNQVATNILGTFAAPDTGGYQIYTWVPLTANGGQYVQVTFDGTSAETLRATWASSGFNVNYFMLMQADTTLPVISGLYPNGQYQFQATNDLSFTASSSVGFDTNEISVQLTGTNLLGQVISTNYTLANGLILGGSTTNLNISLPLVSNAVYTAVITVVAANGKTTTSTVSFDTVAPVFTFEAEDFNYSNGMFIAGVQVDAYSNLNSTLGVDYTNVEIGMGNSSYRPQGLETEAAADKARLDYANGLQDFDIGYAATGNWGNYTRAFPAGVYNIYMRGANGNNGFQPDAANMALVTGDTTTTNQTLEPLGTFSVPGITNASNPWQTYSDVPLLDSDGNYVQFVSSGQPQTLRVTTDNGSYNANYYFLVPAETSLPLNPPKLTVLSSGANVVISFRSWTNATYQLQSASSLTSPNWTPVGANISGNNSILSITNAISGGNVFYRLQMIE